MSVSNENVKETYNGNGSTIYWPITFEIFTTDGSDLVLYETNLTTGETILIDTNLYGPGNRRNSFQGGGCGYIAAGSQLKYFRNFRKKGFIWSKF